MRWQVEATFESSRAVNKTRQLANLFADGPHRPIW